MKDNKKRAARRARQAERKALLQTLRNRLPVLRMLMSTERGGNDCFTGISLTVDSAAKYSIGQLKQFAGFFASLDKLYVAGGITADDFSWKIGNFSTLESHTNWLRTSYGGSAIDPIERRTQAEHLKDMSRRAGKTSMMAAKYGAARR